MTFMIAFLAGFGFGAALWVLQHVFERRKWTVWAGKKYCRTCQRVEDY